ncbi:STAS domain protein [mine drainage metagenome]|uniref:STAS domain protein n=1 Tax=mine drainage metagenome TaxID=410659 RepID=A0A1J5QYT6_9ZZZZ
MDYEIIVDQDSVGTLRCQGRLTLPASGGFATVSDQMKATGCRTWIVDLSGVDFIDSAGMWTLLMMRDVVMQMNGRLTLSGAAGQVAKALRLTRFDDLIGVEP